MNDNPLQYKTFLRIFKLKYKFLSWSKASKWSYLRNLNILWRHRRTKFVAAAVGHHRRVSSQNSKLVNEHKLQSILFDKNFGPNDKFEFLVALAFNYAFIYSSHKVSTPFCHKNQLKKASLKSVTKFENCLGFFAARKKVGSGTLLHNQLKLPSRRRPVRAHESPLLLPLLLLRQQD